MLRVFILPVNAEIPPVILKEVIYRIFQILTNPAGDRHFMVPGT